MTAPQRRKGGAARAENARKRLARHSGVLRAAIYNRDVAIRQARMAGISATEVAEITGLSRQRIYQIVWGGDRSKAVISRRWKVGA